MVELFDRIIDCVNSSVAFFLSRCVIPVMVTLIYDSLYSANEKTACNSKDRYLNQKLNKEKLQSFRQLSADDVKS